MIEWISFNSPKALKGFPMNDRTERKFPVYLPPGYSEKERYPVAYLLAGFSGRGSLYIADDMAFGLPLIPRLDNAISTGAMKPLIIVFPDCSSKLGASQYLNSPVFGNYMDYLCDELVEFIDSKYPTLAHPNARIVAGHSSGGFGALITGFHRPDRFQFVCSSAGDSFFDFSFIKPLNITLIEVEKAGSVEKFVADFLKEPSPSGIAPDRFEAMLMLAMAPCFSPNPEAPPLYGDLFFDLKDGSIRPEVWERYLAWDPVRLVDRFSSNAKQLKYVLLECGKQDEHGLQFGHRQLAQKLSHHKVPHDVVEYPGKHGGHHWRFQDRLHRILEKM